MLSIVEVGEFVNIVTRLATAVINFHSILYLATKDWAIAKRLRDKLIFETSDSAGNPVKVTVTREAGGLVGITIEFNFMGHPMVAQCPVEVVGKGGTLDAIMAEVASRIGGEACTVKLGDLERTAVCRGIGSCTMAVIKP